MLNVSPLAITRTCDLFLPAVGAPLGGLLWRRPKDVPSLSEIAEPRKEERSYDYAEIIVSRRNPRWTGCAARHAGVRRGRRHHQRHRPVEDARRRRHLRRFFQGAS